MKIINVFDDANFVRIEKQENYYGAVVRVADLFGAQKLGFHLEIVDPKNFSCPYHYHEQDEELFLAIDGEAIVRCNNKYKKLKQGDLFFFPVGSEFAHNLYNHTDKPFKFIGISNISTEYDVCHYSDSGKKTSENGIMQNGIKVNYYKDEEHPAKYWPDYALRGEV